MMNNKAQGLSSLPKAGELWERTDIPNKNDIVLVVEVVPFADAASCYVPHFGELSDYYIIKVLQGEHLRLRGAITAAGWHEVYRRIR